MSQGRRRSTHIGPVPGWDAAAAAPEDSRASLKKARTTKRRRRRGLIIGGVIAVFVLFPLAWLGIRGYIAYHALQDAQAQVKAIQTTLKSDTGSIGSVYADLSKNTAQAVSMTSDPIWAAAGHVPLIGPNFAAVKDLATIIDHVVVNGIRPVASVPGLSIDSLKPVNGVIDVDKITALVLPVQQASAGLQAAAVEADALDAAGTISQVAAGVTQVKSLVSQAASLASTAASLMPLLPHALGGDGARNYLFVFQNNAEERASGGNPAALAILTVDHGSIKMTAQASTTDFPSPFPGPILAVEPEVTDIYSTLLTTFMQNATYTPDFPLTALLLRQAWYLKFGYQVDAVVSIDPVALSYLLAVTGPIDLPSGDKLESKTAVQFLLSDVYAKYPNTKDQDAEFAAAAQGVFNALSSGKGSATDYLKAFTKITQERRLLIWSSDQPEQDYILTTPVSGVLPTTNDPKTTIGVYFNDTTSAKMNYYEDVSIDVGSGQCGADGGALQRTTITMVNNAPADAATSLSKYVTGPTNSFPAGGITENVIVYGPVGGAIGATTVDGAAVTPRTIGTDKGRPVALILVYMPVGATVTVVQDTTAPVDASKTIDVRTTPRVRNTPVTIGALACS